MSSRTIISKSTRLLQTTTTTTTRSLRSSRQAIRSPARASLSTSRCNHLRRPAAAATQGAQICQFPRAAEKTRLYSTDSSRAHEISDRGTKIWNFDQMKEIATNPGKVVIVDTREPGELVATGRIPGALNIPISTRPESFFVPEEDFEDSYGFSRPDKDVEVVFYCKAGVRSRAAASLAKEAGWTSVGEYPGSWLDWESNGGQVEK